MLARLKKTSVLLILAGLLAASVITDVSPTEARGKQRSSIPPPPLKIVDISTAPVPYAPGGEPLAMTVEVELPGNIDEDDLLEVTSLISFPSKRSIRFLTQRQTVGERSGARGQHRVNATLLWDGTDQSNEIVDPGTYEYEVRAKLFSNNADGPRTKMVSLRARGKLEVSDPREVSNTAEYPHAEHRPFTSEETAPAELGLEGEGTDPERADVIMEGESREETAPSPFPPAKGEAHTTDPKP